MGVGHGSSPTLRGGRRCHDDGAILPGVVPTSHGPRVAQGGPAHGDEDAASVQFARAPPVAGVGPGGRRRSASSRQVTARRVVVDVELFVFV